MNLQRVINSGFAVNFVSFIARGIPPSRAYPICDLIGSWIAARSESKLTRAVRVNQCMARGANLEKATLDQAARQTLQNNARDIYDLYHHLQNPRAVQPMIRLSPQAGALLGRPEFAERGLVVAGLHLSNFDLILQSLFQEGRKAMILTIPDPQGARRVEYERRKRVGMNLVPASLSAVRQAVNYLEHGGAVLTGIDRPVPDTKYRPKFFGRPACLPTHYSYIASKARVPVVILAAVRKPDGKYHVMSSEPIEMDQYPDHETEILKNAEKVLSRAEQFIRLAPQQWNVPLPIWPDLVGNLLVD